MPYTIITWMEPKSNYTEYQIIYTTSEGLAQGHYVAARVGFEPATFRTQDTEPTTEPPRPMSCAV